MSALYLALDVALGRFGWAEREERSIAGNMWVFMAIALAVAVVRLPTMGFAYLNVDEAVYTLIGSGIKAGQIPYVDIVDRKPVGLFLIYAFAEALFRDGIIGPRILAALATILSSFGLYRFAERFLAVSKGASLAGALLFCTYGLLFGGDAAQAPVFYMPFVIGAGHFVAIELQRLAGGAESNVKSMALSGAMLGIALQIKPSMIFECAAFGGILVTFGVVRWHTISDRNRDALKKCIACMIVGGIAPTLLAGSVYAAIGHFDAWIFYNFTVNLLRGNSDYSRSAILLRAAQFTLCFLPLCVLATIHVRDTVFAARIPRAFENCTWIYALIAAWILLALAGGLALRQPYSHYFYGVLAPLTLLAGAGLHRTGEARLSYARISVLVCVLVLACAGYAYGWRHEINKNGSPYLAYKLARDIKSIGSGSLYVFNHFGILYYLTGEALPTLYPMPNHLLRELEAKSFQFDGTAEVARVLNHHPDTIVVMRPFTAMTAPDRVEVLERALENSYCAWRTYPAGAHTVFIYRAATKLGSEACKARLAEVDG